MAGLYDWAGLSIFNYCFSAFMDKFLFSLLSLPSIYGILDDYCVHDSMKLFLENKSEQVTIT